MSIKKIIPVFGILLFIYLLYKLNIKELLFSVLDLSFWFLLLAIVLVLLQTLLQVYKWNLIMKEQGFNFSLKNLMKMQLKSIFYGVITPAKIGSFVKINYMKRLSGRNVGECASSVIIDRFLDTITISLMALIGSFIIINTSQSVLYYVLIFVILLTISLSCLMNKKMTQFLLKIFYRTLIPNKMKELVKDSFNAFYENLPKTRTLIRPFLVNVITWIVTYAVAFVVAYDLGITSIPFFTFITLYSIATITGLIPITIAGLGTREAALIGLFGLYGVTAERIVALSLITFFISNLPPAVLGGLYAVKDTKVH